MVIQAGGQSSRMGRDKGLLPFQGTTLIQYILGQLNRIGDETLIISNRPGDYENFGPTVYSDVIRDCGALGGIYSAVFYAKHDVCAILACDMPFINILLLHHLINLAPGYDSFIPRLVPNDYAAQFRAVYRKKTCLPAIKQRLDAGELKVSEFFDDVKIRYVEKEELQRFDQNLLSFTNINTPEDLAEAEKLAHQMTNPHV